jgi:hypothetical protein
MNNKMEIISKVLNGEFSTSDLLEKAREKRKELEREESDIIEKIEILNKPILKKYRSMDPNYAIYKYNLSLKEEYKEEIKKAKADFISFIEEKYPESFATKNSEQEFIIPIVKNGNGNDVMASIKITIKEGVRPFENALITTDYELAKQATNNRKELKGVVYNIARLENLESSIEKLSDKIFKAVKDIF